MVARRVFKRGNVTKTKPVLQPFCVLYTSSYTEHSIQHKAQGKVMVQFQVFLKSHSSSCRSHCQITLLSPLLSQYNLLTCKVYSKSSKEEEELSYQPQHTFNWVWASCLLLKKALWENDNSDLLFGLSQSSNIQQHGYNIKGTSDRGTKRCICYTMHLSISCSLA